MKTITSAFILASFMGAIIMGDFQPVSTAAVSLIGGVIRARHDVPPDEKYPRKDCPVCEGKGWYISGDNIERVDCGYCVPDESEPAPEPEDTFQDDQPLVPIKNFYLRK